MTIASDRPAGMGVLIAYPLCLMWSAFWVWLGTSHGLRESGGALGVLAHMVMPGAVFIVLTFLPIWSELIGGFALVAAGCIVGLLNPLLFAELSPELKVPLAMATAVPPLVAGLLFLNDVRKQAKL
jgi:hypothetical protein